MNAQQVGYYTKSGETEPTHNPSLQVDCPICNEPLSLRAIRTFSVMTSDREVSCFYRVHIACCEALTQEQQGILDMEANNIAISEARKRDRSELLSALEELLALGDKHFWSDTNKWPAVLQARTAIKKAKG